MGADAQRAPGVIQEGEVKVQGEKMSQEGIRKMNYNDMFLKLRCSTDVLNAVYPLNRPRKEISESMAIIQKIKGLTIRNPGLLLLDLCAGNALTSILAAHLLPIHEAEAFDIRENKRDFSAVKKFSYTKEDIVEFPWDSLRHTIIISSHPCKLATKIIDIFNKSDAKALCIIPCCRGEWDLPQKHFLHNFVPDYDLWSYYLSTLIKTDHVQIVKDRRILSPCNNVIYAERG